MAIERIGTADNREEWLKLRKSYLTASAVYGWQGPDHADPKNAWYFKENNREAILAEKFDGVDKEFDAYSTVSMKHGAYDEANIIAKTGLLLGCDVEPDNSMFCNARWPNIAVTVDGYIGPPARDAEYNFCHDRKQVDSVRETLATLGPEDKTVLEIKKSVSVGWARGEVAEYYLAQVRTQLSVLELDFGVISAECLVKHHKERWRMFWGLRPFIIERSPVWEKVLDRVNEEFGAEKEKRS